MHTHTIAVVAIASFVFAGCSGELAQRPAVADPTNAASPEAPFKPPPGYVADPLLSPVLPKSSEPQPLGSEPAHSPTAAPPGNPPMREEPGGHQPAHVYTCPMHPEVRSSKQGTCPKCGMTLVPVQR